MRWPAPSPASGNDGKITDEKTCTDQRDSVYTSKAGEKICPVLIIPCFLLEAQVSTTCTWDPPKGMSVEKACADKKGTIYSDEAGHKVCVLPPPRPASN